MSKKRGILVKKEEYYTATELLRKAGISATSTITQWHFNLVSAFPAAIVGGAIVWFIMSRP